MAELGSTDASILGLPTLHPDEFMVAVFHDIRPTRPVGMAEGPTDWDVIAPYGAVNGLDDEDMQILAKMCFGFCKAREEGTNPLGIAPVDRE